MNISTEPKGAVLASEEFSVNTNVVNVRVKGVNRSQIPGSFKVHLLKDSEVIASRAFYQSTGVTLSEEVAGNPIVNFDFELPISTISNGKLSIRVEPHDSQLHGNQFPHDLLGNPTVNIRLLIHTKKTNSNILTDSMFYHYPCREIVLSCLQ